MADAGNSKVLTARVNIDISSAERQLNRLSNRISDLNNAFNRTGNAGRSVERNIRRATSAANRLNNATRQNSQQATTLRGRFESIRNTIRTLPTHMYNFSNSIRSATHNGRELEDVFDRLYRKIKAVAATYLGVMGTKALVAMSDSLTSAQNRLNDYNSGQLGSEGIVTNADGTTSYSDKTIQATSTQMDKMYAAAQRARTGYDDMLKNVSKSMVLAGSAFGDNMDNAVRFQEVMGKAYTLGGASAEEQASSMYQMIQALGAGTLAGDELRSVREGAPLAYQAIEEYAQGIYNSEEALKDMASQGLITSNIVVAAMMNAGDNIDERFANTAMTFNQAWQMIKNSATKAFQPILQYMNEFLNSDIGKKAIEIANEIIIATSYAVAFIVKIVTAIATFIINHWETIRTIVVTVVTFLTAFVVSKWVSAVALVIWNTMQLIYAHPVLAVIATLVAAIVGLIVYIAKTSENVADFIMKVAFVVAMAIITIVLLIGVYSLITGTVIMSIPMAIALLVIAVLAILIYAFLKYTDKIVGYVYVIGAAFQNTWAFIKNLGLALWESLKANATNIGVVFTNAWHNAASAFWDFMASCMEGLKDFEPALNAIAKLFGKDEFTVSGAVEKMQEKADYHESKLKDYVDVNDAWNDAFHTYDYKDLDVAYRSGSEKGNVLQNKLKNIQVSDLVSGLTGMDGLLSTDDLNIDNAENALNTDDYEAIMGNNAALNDISDDTSNISDSMDILDTDLKYLKELGEREAINKFTTAEIRVEMKNDNYISERVDMDGVVNYLSDKLYEELGVVANGVHY